jgi:hypothetical protein
VKLVMTFLECLLTIDFDGGLALRRADLLLARCSYVLAASIYTICLRDGKEETSKIQKAKASRKGKSRTLD